ncbi:hypothetical protein AAG906_011236 [Vitis piasezkii]
MFQMQADDILVDYVNGLHPIPSMKWCEVDIIYRRIFVYDSLIGINSDRLKGAIIPLAKVLPRILHATSYYGKSGDPKSEE